MSKRIIIAKDGYDAETETDPENKVFDSQYDTLKYYQSGEVTISATGNDVYETTIVHGLGYIPFFIAYVNRFAGSADYYSLCPGFFAAIGNFIHASVYADSDKLYFQVKRDGSLSGDFNFKYKIFRNRTGL